MSNESEAREVPMVCPHECQHRATSCDVCPACVSDAKSGGVRIPRDLAQRILAALEREAFREGCRGFPATTERLRALARELREVLKK